MANTEGSDVVGKVENEVKKELESADCPGADGGSLAGEITGGEALKEST